MLAEAPLLARSRARHERTSDGSPNPCDSPKGIRHFLFPDKDTEAQSPHDN